MPISVNCSECGKSLKAPDTLAGKKAKCPQCGAVVPIPAAVLDAELIDEPPPLPKKSSAQSKPKPKPADDDGSMFDDAAEFEAKDPADDRKPCPMCGEMIAQSAAKCRFCGELFDAGLRKRSQSKSGSRSGDQDPLTGWDIALCVLCSNIGCIIGIVACIRGQTSRGGKMIGIALLINVIVGVISMLAQAGRQQQFP